MARKSKDAGAKAVKAITHRERRTNIPTAQTQALMRVEEATPASRLYPRNPDLDPQLVWRGKDAADREPLRVETVPIYIQEKIHPHAIIEDVKRRGAAARGLRGGATPDLFADFNGFADEAAKFDFYSHDAGAQPKWQNRMILGDGLLVMNSLAEKEGLKGKVQTIYLDPPYGIRFSSNWQPSTKKREVREGKAEDVSREPEVVKAFRDTWADGIHSYLSYLRDRLVVARELLTESGSVFVQIGKENVHVVRCLLDEVFGTENHVAQIAVQKTGSQTGEFLQSNIDFLLWSAKDRVRAAAKFNRLFLTRGLRSAGGAPLPTWISLMV